MEAQEILPFERRVESNKPPSIALLATNETLPQRRFSLSIIHGESAIDNAAMLEGYHMQQAAV